MMQRPEAPLSFGAFSRDMSGRYSEPGTPKPLNPNPKAPNPKHPDFRSSFGEDARCTARQMKWRSAQATTVVLHSRQKLGVARRCSNGDAFQVSLGSSKGMPVQNNPHLTMSRVAAPS